MAVPSRWPRLIASSVIRGAHLGESHGGIYLLNLETGVAELKIDWNRTDIDFSGRGGDRGLRGIAFDRDRILIAANAQLLVFDTEFRLLETHANRFLKHCHEICVDGRNVYLTSTGFDSVLVFDLDTKRFTEGWHLAAAAQGPVLRYYDPSSTTGPAESHRFHINSVSAASSRIWLSGLYTPGLLLTDRRTLQIVAPLPWGCKSTLCPRAVYFAGRIRRSGLLSFHGVRLRHASRRAAVTDEPVDGRAQCDPWPGGMAVCVPRAAVRQHLRSPTAELLQRWRRCPHYSRGPCERRIARDA